MKVVRKIIREIKKLIMYSIVIIVLFLFIANDNGKVGDILNSIRNDAFPLAKQKTTENSSIYMLARELKQVGNLICYQGKYTYIYYDEEYKWYGSKSINATLIYNFGLGIDFSTIEIKIDNNRVYARMPKDGIKISFIELENKDSTIDYFNSIFMEKYDINRIQRECRENVEHQILKEKIYFEEAAESVRNRVAAIAKEFGYDKVEFK